MAKLFLGELVFTHNKLEYTLRPSLGALYEVEQLLKRPVIDVCRQLYTSPNQADITWIILQQCYAASCGARMRLPALSKRKLAALQPIAHGVLLRGLGCNNMQQLQDVSAPKWEALYDTARVVLCISEDEFWHITLPGLLRMIAAKARLEEQAIEAIGPPARQADLLAMMEQFPDERVLQQL